MELGFVRIFQVQALLDDSHDSICSAQSYKYVINVGSYISNGILKLIKSLLILSICVSEKILLTFQYKPELLLVKFLNIMNVHSFYLVVQVGFDCVQ